MKLRRILIVDDEMEPLTSLSKRLTALGYHMIHATHSAEAVDKAKHQFPDLILMDIILPDVDGAETVTLLQQDPVTKHIPVIFLSGIAPPKEEGQKYPRIVAGGISYLAIPKPFTFDELYFEIKKILGP